MAGERNCQRPSYVVAEEVGCAVWPTPSLRSRSRAASLSERGCRPYCTAYLFGDDVRGALAVPLTSHAVSREWHRSNGVACLPISRACGVPFAEPTWHCR